MEIRVAGRYKLVKKLGNGAFGDVFQAVNEKKSEEVAIKLEKINAKTQHLNYEYRMYKLFQG